ncbi:MAG: serine/threonine-protein kinase [Gemmatimonadaceae bacterium]
MTNPPSPPPDDRTLNRAALERVLARAMELHVRGEDTDAVRSDELSESRVLEIAREVGIAPEAVRQAIAEERARSPLAEAQRESDAMLADPTISAARVLTGSPSELLGRLEALLARDESLGVIRRFPDRIVLEPRSGLMDQITRSMDFGGKGYYLSRAREVVVSVGAVDARRTHVAVAADLRSARNKQLATPVWLVVIGVLAGAPLAVLTVFPWLGVLPPLALGWLGWKLGRSAWRALRRQALVSVERLLDKLEYPDKPSPAQQLIDGLARSLLPPK